MKRHFPSVLLFLVAVLPSCNGPTPPDDPIECPPGYHLCGEDSTDCCLDTTSHNFVWSVDTLKGDYNYLKDVSIVGANDIWVVGEIRMPEARYYAARWDGDEWHLFQVGTGTKESVYAFSATDVWVASTAPYHLENGQWIGYGVQNSSWEFDGYVLDIWGNDFSDVYFVGTNGAIAHYDGTDFEKMPSGTSITLHSVAGSGTHVFVAGFNDLAESVVLELRDGQWHTLLHSTSYRGDLDNGDYGMASAVDVLADTAYIMTTEGLLKYAYQTDEFFLVPRSVILTQNLTIIVMKVSSTNDIHLFSGRGRHIHYNGVSWKRNEEMVFDYLYHGADYRDDIATMVGSIGGVGGFVMIGQRIE